MPNPLYTYILKIWFVNAFCWYTQLNDQTVLFLRIQFKNAAINIEQVLEATPHKAPTIRSPTSHHEKYPSSTNQTCRTLLEKQGRTHKWCTPMDPTYGQAKAGRPARTYIQQRCEDTGCSPEDLTEAMNDREKWRERVRDIRASSTTWWWWWWCVKVKWFQILLCITNNLIKYQSFVYTYWNGQTILSLTILFSVS